MPNYDFAVIGLGAVGSAVAYQLAKRGCQVLGLDQFRPPHPHGSTHGESRLTRLAMGEGDAYMPLARRARELWEIIEREAGTPLFTPSGYLLISPRARSGQLNFFERTLLSAKKHAVTFELLTPDELRARFPTFNVNGNDYGYYEPSAGFLHAERSVRAQIALAKQRGATIRTSERLLSFKVTKANISLLTETNAYCVQKMIVSAGPWVSMLLGKKYSGLFQVYRQAMFWFRAKCPEAFKVDHFPAFIWELDPDRRSFYGFPAANGSKPSIKVASEEYVSVTTPAAMTRQVSRSEISAIYTNYVQPHLSALSANCVRAVPCMYTMTPDSHFIIDTHPEFDHVLVASACSGHGFKHSAAVGEVLSQMALSGRSEIDVTPFAFSRLIKQ